MPNNKNLEGFRSKYPDALTEAAVDFGEPPAAQRKEIMRDLKGILTAPGNLHRDTRANNEFQQALNRDTQAPHHVVLICHKHRSSLQLRMK